jgi:hypothetical protein
MMKIDTPDCCYSINDFNRWRIDLSNIHNKDTYVKSMKRWYRCNYMKSKKTFQEYGCTTTITKGDWFEYAERFYALYSNVAQRHGDWLYDLQFFREVAKRDDYKLLCAWHEGEIIAAFLLCEESPTLHSVCCGLDYEHSSESFAYSWLHYALIESAIESERFTEVDVGLTADDAKRAIGFQPIPSRMDIYSSGAITRNLLKVISKLVKTSITPGSKLKFSLG